jgi:hypothetical protein
MSLLTEVAPGVRLLRTKNYAPGRLPSSSRIPSTIALMSLLTEVAPGVRLLTAKKTPPRTVCRRPHVYATTIYHSSAQRECAPEVMFTRIFLIDSSVPYTLAYIQTTQNERQSMSLLTKVAPGVRLLRAKKNRV